MRTATRDRSRYVSIGGIGTIGGPWVTQGDIQIPYVITVDGTGIIRVNVDPAIIILALQITPAQSYYGALNQLTGVFGTNPPGSARYAALDQAGTFTTVAVAWLANALDRRP